MNAFAQTLNYRFVHFIRIGEEAREHGDPWQYGVVGVSDDGVSLYLLGFAGEVDMKLTRAVMRVAKYLDYKEVTWDRREVQADGTVTFRPVKFRIV